MNELPKPPAIKLEELDKQVPADARAFLKVKRSYHQITYIDGSTSEPFPYDVLERVRTDAVVIICHAIVRNMRCVYLRSAIRPALATVDYASIWELPAGLIEHDESPAQSAARETLEELGFSLEAEQFKELGEFSFPAVGHCAERIFFYEVEANASTRQEPSLDGSPLEHQGEIIILPLENAHKLACDGAFNDMKTELGIRRLADAYR